MVDPRAPLGRQPDTGRTSDKTWRAARQSVAAFCPPTGSTAQQSGCSRLSPMQDTSLLVAPIRVLAVCEQPQLQRLFGNNLLQSGGLAAQILHLIAGCRTRRVPRQPTLASFEELLRPDVIEALSNALTPAQFCDAVVSAQPVQHNPDLVFRREVPPCRPANVFQYPFSWRLQTQGFWSHLRSFVTAMRPKPSLNQYRNSVS